MRRRLISNIDENGNWVACRRDNPLTQCVCFGLSVGVLTLNAEYNEIKYMKKICILILLMVAPLFGQNKNMPVTGTATNSSGNHVSGVKVCLGSWNCVLTDTNGFYKIDVTLSPSIIYIPSIRFSHQEYNAVIKIVSNNKIDVVLQKITKESDNKRIISDCSNNDNLVGLRYKLIIPSINIIKADDIDYEAMFVPSSKNKDSYLRLLNGFNASSGLPSNVEWPFLEEPDSILHNRDIEYENQRKNESGIPINPLIDVKAQSDGKFWRFIGNSFNVISYSNISEEAAREFDDIMDTLCYSSPTVNNQH